MGFTHTPVHCVESCFLQNVGERLTPGAQAPAQVWQSFLPSLIGIQALVCSCVVWLPLRRRTPLASETNSFVEKANPAMVSPGRSLGQTPCLEFPRSSETWLALVPLPCWGHPEIRMQEVKASSHLVTLSTGTLRCGAPSKAAEWAPATIH